MKLKYDELCSSFALNFNVCPYIKRRCVPQCCHNNVLAPSCTFTRVVQASRLFIDLFICPYISVDYEIAVIDVAAAVNMQASIKAVAPADLVVALKSAGLSELSSVVVVTVSDAIIYVDYPPPPRTAPSPPPPTPTPPTPTPPPTPMAAPNENGVVAGMSLPVLVSAAFILALILMTASILMQRRRRRMFPCRDAATVLSASDENICHVVPMPVENGGVAPLTSHGMKD